MVAHTFTCPTGLFYSTLTDGCDFRRNVDCEGKDEKEVKATTEAPLEDEDDEDEEVEEDPKSLKELLNEIKSAG